MIKGGIFYESARKTILYGLFITSVLFLLGCTTQTSSNTTYTLQDLSAHNSPTDCWIALDGNVYNITPMLANIPAGVPNQFENSCGMDVTIFQGVRVAGGDFNGVHPVINGTGDFNSARVPGDFNRMRTDFNGAHPDFNGARPSGGIRSGRGFTQYLIGKLI